MFELIAEGRGIEVHLLEKNKQYRVMKKQDPTDDALQDGIDTFMRCFIRQRGGPTARKRYINRQLHLVYDNETVHLPCEGSDQNCLVEEPRWRNGWLSVNYGAMGRPGNDEVEFLGHMFSG